MSTKRATLQVPVREESPDTKGLLSALERRATMAQLAGNHVQNATLSELIVIAGSLKYKARLAREALSGADREAVEAIFSAL